jgi:hypothetical protein
MVANVGPFDVHPPLARIASSAAADVIRCADDDVCGDTGTA